MSSKNNSTPKPSKQKVWPNKFSADLTPANGNFLRKQKTRGRGPTLIINTGVTAIRVGKVKLPEVAKKK